MDCLKFQGETLLSICQQFAHVYTTGSYNLQVASHAINYTLHTESLNEHPSYQNISSPI